MATEYPFCVTDRKENMADEIMKILKKIVGGDSNFPKGEEESERMAEMIDDMRKRQAEYDESVDTSIELLKFHREEEKVLFGRKESAPMTLEERAEEAARAGWYLTDITIDGQQSIMAINPTNENEVWYWSPPKKKWINEKSGTEAIPLCKHSIKE
jgi:hypothetical protein